MTTRALACLIPALTLFFGPACTSEQACGGDGSNCINEVGTGTETETGDSGDGDGDTGDGDGDTGDGDGDGDGDSGDGDGDTGGVACMGDTPIVVFETTLGTMVAQLDGVRAPVTVANFAMYVDAGFYDGTIIHRVIKDFVIQGGGFEPGLVEKSTLGPIPLEIDPQLRHVDGAIAMARRAEPDTAESQWYITDGAQPGLDDMYAVFGVLIDGFAVRDAIADVPVQDVPFMGSMLGDVPVEDVVVLSAYCVDSWP